MNGESLQPCCSVLQNSIKSHCWQSWSQLYNTVPAAVYIPGFLTHSIIVENTAGVARMQHRGYI